MVSVQDWKTAECAKVDDDDDSDHIEAIEALASLLEGDITSTDAAKTITKTYEASLMSTEGRWKQPHWHISKVHDFWSRYMFDAIRSFGSAEEHERLFQLLIEISRQPDLEDYGGMVVSIHDKVFWSDLPGWECFPDEGLCKSIFLITQSCLLTEHDRLSIRSEISSWRERIVPRSKLEVFDWDKVRSYVAQ